jgi:anti-anti-sigma regulatory factor
VNIIVLPFTLDAERATMLRARIERAPPGSSLVFDGSRVRYADPAGTQLLCALVLAAEGRGVAVTWTAVSSVFVTYVNLLGFGAVMRFERVRPYAPVLSESFN